MAEAGGILYALHRWLYFATCRAFSDVVISCRISSTEVIYRWKNYMSRFLSGSAGYCGKTAKRKGLTRQQLSEKKKVQSGDRQISAIELGEKGPS